MNIQGSLEPSPPRTKTAKDKKKKKKRKKKRKRKKRKKKKKEQKEEGPEALRIEPPSTPPHRALGGREPLGLLASLGPGAGAVPTGAGLREGGTLEQAMFYPKP